jgi:hypothetical protein
MIRALSAVCALLIASVVSANDEQRTPPSNELPQFQSRTGPLPEAKERTGALPEFKSRAGGLRQFHSRTGAPPNPRLR